jgi:hypothetical protein
VHRKNILIYSYVQQDATLHSLFFLETALHVSAGTATHHQERKQLYLQHLVFVTPLLLPLILVYAQQGVTLFGFLENCSTCPSSGAQTTVSTASGICHTVTATSNICPTRRNVIHFFKRLYMFPVVEQFPEKNKLCNVASYWIYIRIEYKTELLPILALYQIICSNYRSPCCLYCCILCFPSAGILN